MDTASDNNVVAPAPDGASSNYSPPSLVGVLQHKEDVFGIISGFVGNPFDFRRLGQTCHAMNKYFALDNDNVWKMSLAYTDPSDENEDLKWGDYLEDNRLPAMWEKSMVKAVRGKVYLEQQKTDLLCDHNLIILIFVSGLTDSRWGPAPHGFEYWRSIQGAAVTERDDTRYALAALVEGNLLQYIHQAHLLACARSAANGTFPCITLEDMKAAPLRDALEGPTAASIAFGDFFGQDHPYETFPLCEKAACQLFRRAGVIKWTSEVLGCIWEMAHSIMLALPDVMAKLQETCDTASSLQHPANIHMKKFPPKMNTGSTDPSREWMPTPGMLTMAAKALKLPITTFYDTEERINVNDTFWTYYNRLTPKEKHEYKLSMEFKYNPFTDYDFDENEDDESSQGEYEDDESMDDISIEDEESDGWSRFSIGSDDDFDDDDVSMSGAEA